MVFITELQVPVHCFIITFTPWAYSKCQFETSVANRWSHPDPLSFLHWPLLLLIMLARNSAVSTTWFSSWRIAIWYSCRSLSVSSMMLWPHHYINKNDDLLICIHFYATEPENPGRYAYTLRAFYIRFEWVVWASAIRWIRSKRVAHTLEGRSL